MFASVSKLGIWGGCGCGSNNFTSVLRNQLGKFKEVMRALARAIIPKMATILWCYLRNNAQTGQRYIWQVISQRRQIIY